MHEGFFGQATLGLVLARQTDTPRTMRGTTDSHTALSIVTDDFRVYVRRAFNGPEDVWDRAPRTDCRRSPIWRPVRSNLVQSA